MWYEVCFARHIDEVQQMSSSVLQIGRVPLADLSEGIVGTPKCRGTHFPAMCQKISLLFGRLKLKIVLPLVAPWSLVQAL